MGQENKRVESGRGRANNRKFAYAANDTFLPTIAQRTGRATREIRHRTTTPSPPFFGRQNAITRGINSNSTRYMVYLALL